MKKYLMIVLAAVAVIFASCEPTETGGDSSLTALKFKQAEITILVGDTVPVALLAEPTGATIPANVVVTSSNEEVVKVIDNKVTITGIGSGEANVTAKVGELSAVCKVTVRKYEEVWYPSLMFYFPDTKSALPLSDKVVEFEYPSGIYKCKFYTVTVVGVNGYDFDDNAEGSGYGWMADATALFIEETPAGKESFKGDIWDLGLIIVDEEELDTTDLGALAGQIDPAVVGQVLQDALTGKTEKLDKDAYLTGVKGAHICQLEVEGNSVSYSYFYDGLITAGAMIPTYDEEGYANGCQYNILAQWCYGFYGYGIAINPDYNPEDASTYLKQPFELALSAPYHYKNGQIGQIVNPTTPAKKIARPTTAKWQGMKVTRDAKQLRAAKYCKEIQK